MSGGCDPREAAIVAAFGLFRVAYAAKWSAGEADVPSWAILLDDVEPGEILAAAKVWARSHPWPPSPAQLRNSVPRLCQCGKCGACQMRALERARRAVERGSLGCDPSDSPATLGTAAREVLERDAQRRLGP